MRQAMLSNDDFKIDTRLIRRTEHLDDSPRRWPPGDRGTNDRDIHEVPVGRAIRIRTRDANVIKKPLIDGRYDALCSLLSECAHDRSIRAMEDQLDLTFAAAIARARDAGNNKIAVQCFAHRASRNPQIALFSLARIVGNNKGVT